MKRHPLSFLTRDPSLATTRQKALGIVLLLGGLLLASMSGGPG